jgi:hypothetical protein
MGWRGKTPYPLAPERAKIIVRAMLLMEIEKMIRARGQTITLRSKGLPALSADERTMAEREFVAFGLARLRRGYTPTG